MQQDEMFQVTSLARTWLCPPRNMQESNELHAGSSPAEPRSLRRKEMAALQSIDAHYREMLTAGFRDIVVFLCIITPNTACETERNCRC